MLGILTAPMRTITRALYVAWAPLLLPRAQMESMMWGNMRAMEPTMAMRVTSYPVRGPLLQILLTPILPILPPLKLVPDGLLPTYLSRLLQALRISFKEEAYGRLLNEPPGVSAC
ncbi:hypothetical protein C356_02033 [Cryptococcus neoformans c45]|nr:hypothetical protein C356_02033 [Cryptococcus neoformans var. grubii c45]